MKQTKKRCSNSLNVRDILIKEIVKYKIDIIKHKTIIGRVINNLFLSNKSLSERSTAKMRENT